MSQTDWPIVLLDGGLGTTLTEPPYNFTFDETTPLWSSHLLHAHPSLIRDLHAAFADAGADILLTATYQSSEEGFKRTLGSDAGKDQIWLLMNLATRIAQNGLDMAPHKPDDRIWGNEFKTPCLALSLGPLGATLVPSQEYSGKYPEYMSNQAALKAWHDRRLEAFDRSPAYGCLEFIAFETLKRTDEVRAIRESMSAYQWKPNQNQNAFKLQEGTNAAKHKWWISTVWPDNPMDEQIKEMVEALLENRDSADSAPAASEKVSKTYPPAPWAIGVNCTAIEKVAAIIERMEAHVATLARSGRWQNEWAPEGSSDWPWLVLYPDGAKGLRYDSTTRSWVEAENAALHEVEWHEALWSIATEIRHRRQWAGLVLGGCCKTNPMHIQHLRAKIDQAGCTS